MTKQPKSTAVQSVSPASNQNVDPAAAGWNAVHACFDTGQAVLKSAFALNREMVEFAGRRLNADFEAFQSLCHCRNWQELFERQGEFVRSFAEAYQDEFSKVTERTVKATADAWKPLLDAAEPPVDETSRTRTAAE